MDIFSKACKNYLLILMFETLLIHDVIWLLWTKSHRTVNAIKYFRHIVSSSIQFQVCTNHCLLVVWVMKCIFLIFALVFIHTNAQGIPPELKCFMRGLTNRSCGAKIRQVCSEFKGDDKKPIPIPKSQFGGQCPMLGQVIPLASSIAEANVDLPPCPCENGVGVILYILHKKTR